MFLEKFSRFFRQYEFTFAPRHKNAPYLPLKGVDVYSVQDALKQKLDQQDALEVFPNGDIVELMVMEYREPEEALVLLFHRASPDAADPAYRKKARASAATKYTVRTATKEDGEEQSVSAHLVILDKPRAKGIYPAALEEIPGVIMSAMRRIIARALSDYPYDFERKNKRIDTYSMFKPQGIKSESLTNALKTGEADWLTLSKQGKAPFPDSEGLFQPGRETLRLKVVGKLSSGNWKAKIKEVITHAKKAGWTDFQLDLDLEDNRRTRVKLERDEEAKEILFVRAQQMEFSKELEVCSVKIRDEIVKKAVALLNS